MKIAGGYIRKGVKYLWHYWYVQELELNQPLFKNPSMLYPDDLLGEVLDPRTSGMLLPCPYISLN